MSFTSRKPVANRVLLIVLSVVLMFILKGRFSQADLKKVLREVLK